MKKIITFSLLSIFSSFSDANAQLDPPSTIFWNNYTSFNPAYSGLNSQQASLGYRDEMDKNSWSERSLAASYNMKIDKLHGGLGINYSLRQTNPSLQNKVDVNYSYHFSLGKNSVIAAGVSAGILNLDERVVFGWGTNGGVYYQNLKKTELTMNAGIVYRRKGFVVGISSTKINGPRFSNFYIPPMRSYQVNASYLFRITPNMEIRPHILYTTNLQYSSLDLNAVIYFKRFWTGATYRTNSTYAVMGGWDFRHKYRLGYSYDLVKSFTNNGLYFGVHEVVLGLILSDRGEKGCHTGAITPY